MAALSGGTLTLVDKSQELPAKVRTYVRTCSRGGRGGASVAVGWGTSVRMGVGWW